MTRKATKAAASDDVAELFPKPAKAPRRKYRKRTARPKKPRPTVASLAKELAELVKCQSKAAADQLSMRQNVESLRKAIEAQALARSPQAAADPSVIPAYSTANRTDGARETAAAEPRASKPAIQLVSMIIPLFEMLVCLQMRDGEKRGFQASPLASGKLAVTRRGPDFIFEGL